MSDEASQTTSGSNTQINQLTRHLSRMGQNGVVQPLLTDLYQITMTYAYWKGGKTNDQAVFDLYFRKNPFKGEFTIFAGLEECVKLIENFAFSASDIDYLKTVLPPATEPEFFSYLLNIDTQHITLHAIPEGTVVFPKVPLLVLEGPLAVLQLLETTLLNLVNYASLVATNAARFRLAAGKDVCLLEFGLRRAQGPDGGLSASRYCYLGGFDGTSNVLAGKLYDIPVGGTHAHAFVTSFTSTDDIKVKELRSRDGARVVDFVQLCDSWLERLQGVIDFLPDQVNRGELAAFISYASAFPDGFLALIDTYDVMRSGLPNFCAVALALHDIGYTPRGIRLDSGDLAYLSNYVRKVFTDVAQKFDLAYFASLNIVASNDINEDTIHSLNQQGHSINTYGVGTHLVTCQRQPALGCVFKLVEVNGDARMKLSEDVEKVTLPGRKVVYRCFGADGTPLVDLMQRVDEPPPLSGSRILCHHPVQPTKRAYVSPALVEPLHKVYWKNGKVMTHPGTMKELRERTCNCLNKLRSDHKRTLNPTPYKVSVSSNLYTFIQDIWQRNAPIGELS